MNSPACADPIAAGTATTVQSAPPALDRAEAVLTSVHTLPAIDSATLLQGARAIHILHNGETYRLQTTRQGKLILTK
jgi:hemin uptake protein HemP